MRTGTSTTTTTSNGKSSGGGGGGSKNSSTLRAAEANVLMSTAKIQDVISTAVSTVMRRRTGKVKDDADLKYHSRARNFLLPLSYKEKVYRKRSPWRQRLERVGLVCLFGVVAFLIGAACIPYEYVESYKDTFDNTLKWLEENHYFEPVYGFQTEGYLESYPELKLLEDNFDILQREMEEALQLAGTENLPNLPDVAMFKAKMWRVPWRSLFFANGFFIPENEKYAPQTVALLKQIPYVYTALYSIVEPGQRFPPHFGHWKGYIRYQLPLKVPPNNDVTHQCWIRSVPKLTNKKEYFDQFRVGNYSLMEHGGVKHYYRERQGFLFDDVFAHDVSNDSDQMRVILFLDLARKMPWYLNIINKAILAIAIRGTHMRKMRQNAILHIDGDSSSAHLGNRVESVEVKKS